MYQEKPKDRRAAFRRARDISLLYSYLKLPMPRVLVYRGLRVGDKQFNSIIRNKKFNYKSRDLQVVDSWTTCPHSALTFSEPRWTFHQHGLVLATRVDKGNFVAHLNDKFEKKLNSINAHQPIKWYHEDEVVLWAKGKMYTLCVDIRYIVTHAHLLRSQIKGYDDSPIAAYIVSKLKNEQTFLKSTENTSNVHDSYALLQCDNRGDFKAAKSLVPQIPRTSQKWRKVV